MGQTQDTMISSLEEETITVGADDFRKSMASTLAAATGLFFDSPEVLPANRSTLSSITNDRILKKSRDCKRLHSVGHKSKDPEEQDYEVVDLTGDRTPLGNQDIINSMVVPCSSKLRRTSEIASPDSGRDLSLKTCNSGCLPGTSSTSCTSNALELSSNEPKEHASFVGSKGCLQSLLNVDVKSGTIFAAKRSDKELLEKANAFSTTNEQTRGSAFLFQVQEKLTPAEYREFVGLMKALKSKAMKILPVLESIAKLFSSPERLCLLHGFKDYVPAKFRPYYEQHISALSTSDRFEGTLQKRLS